MAVRRNLMVGPTQGHHEAGHFWPRLTKSLLACVVLPVSTDLGSEMSASSCASVRSDMTPVASMIFCSGEVKSSQNFWCGALPRAPPLAAEASRGSAPHPARAAALDPLFAKKHIYFLHLISEPESPEPA